MHLLWVGEDVLETVQPLVLGLGTLVPRVRLAPGGVDGRRLLHHLRQKLLRLTALSSSFLLLVLLLGLHPSIVKSVDPSICSTIYASVGGIQPLRLRCYCVRNVLACWIPRASLEVVFRHGDITTCIERGTESAVLRTRVLLVKVSDL